MGQNKNEKLLPKYFIKVGREGCITVQQRGLSYRLRWTYHGKTMTLPIGKGSDAYKIALARAKEINSDLMLGRYDETLIKYNPTKARLLAVTESENKSLPTHWNRYLELTPLSKSTTAHVRTINNLIKLANEKSKDLLLLENASEFFSFSLSVYAPSTLETAYKLLIAAINLAKSEDRVQSNPYTKYKKILVGMIDASNNGGESKRTREAYSNDELEAIFDAFYNNTYCPPNSAYKHSYYLPYVKFLAFTGCRPEEAIALTKDDVIVKDSRKFLSINKAYTNGELKGTKTEESRVIPINDELADVLNSAYNLCPESPLFFPSIKDKTYMNQGRFQTETMAKITSALYADGKISKVLPTYNLRHTRITALLRDGINPSTVAQLMGTSVEMLNRHYCGNLTEGLTLPPMMKPL